MPYEDDLPPGPYDTWREDFKKSPIAKRWYNQYHGKALTQPVWRTYGPLYTRENYHPISRPPQPWQNEISQSQYDALTPTEKWTLGKLSGINDNAIFQGISKFMAGPFGKALSYLDIGAEGVERTLGLFAQAGEAAKNPETWSAFMEDLGHAWYAGSLAYNVSNLPQFKWDGNTPAGIQIPAALPGTQGLIKARQRIEELVNQGLTQGQALVQAKEEMYNDLGALSFRSELYDTYGHILLDPLNIIMPYLKPVERTQAAAKMIRGVKYADETIDDIRVSLKLAEEAGDFAEIWKQANRVGPITDITRTAIREAQDVGDATRAARAVTQLIPGRSLTQKDKFVLLLTGGDQFAQPGNRANKLLRKLNPFELTDASRAYEYVTTVSDNIGGRVIRTADNEVDLTNKMNNIMQGALGDDLGHAFLTLEGRYAQATATRAAQHANDLLSRQTLAARELAQLDGIAKALGETPGKVLAMISDGQEATLATKLGNVTPDALKTLGEKLKDVPIDFDMFKFELMNKVIDVAAEEGIALFGVKSRGLLQKFSMMLKSAESLAFLRLNPSYMIRNVTNNEMTMLARGLFGRVGSGWIEDFWKRAGWTPERLGQGFGSMGEVAISGKKVTEGTARIQEALRGERGFLDKAAEAFGNVNLGKLDMGAASGAMEKGASRRAFTHGYIQGMKRYFWRPGTGIPGPEEYFTRAMLDEIARLKGPGFFKTLQENIANAVNPKEISDFTKADTNLNLNTTGILEDAAKLTGAKIEDMLGDDFVVTKLEGIAEAAKQGRLEPFLASLREEITQHLDELSEKEMETFAGYVTNRVQAEGDLGVAGVYNKMVDTLWEGHADYALYMEMIQSRLQDLGNPEIKARFWKDFKATSRRYWDKQYQRLDRGVRGMKEGAAKAGVKIPDDVETSLTRIRKGYTRLFAKHDKDLDIYFAARLKGKPTVKTLEQIQEEMDQGMLEMIALEAKGYTKVDTAIADLIRDPRQRDTFLKYRQKIAGIKAKDKEAVVNLRKELSGLSPQQRRVKYLEFWRQRYERLAAVEKWEKVGNAASQGSESAIRAIDDLPINPRSQNILDDIYDKSIDGTNAIPLQYQDIYDEISTKLEGLVRDGEPGARLWGDNESGQYTVIGSRQSTYPEFYGAMKRNKEDVLKAFQKSRSGWRMKNKLVEEVRSMIITEMEDDPRFLLLSGDNEGLFMRLTRGLNKDEPLLDKYGDDYLNRFYQFLEQYEPPAHLQTEAVLDTARNIPKSKREAQEAIQEFTHTLEFRRKNNLTEKSDLYPLSMEETEAELARWQEALDDILDQERGVQARLEEIEGGAGEAAIPKPDVLPTTRQEILDEANKLGVATASEKGTWLDNNVLLKIVNGNLDLSMKPYGRIDDVPLEVARKSFRRHVAKHMKVPGEQPLEKFVRLFGDEPDILYGIWSRNTAKRLGMTDKEIDNLITDGHLIEQEIGDTGEMSLLLKSSEIHDNLRVANQAIREGRARRAFVGDLDHIAPEPEPIARAQEELYKTRGFAALEAIEQAARERAARPSLIWDDLPENIKQSMGGYINYTKSKMSDAQYAATRFAEFRRDSALLNYNRRFNYNTWLGTLAPFEFWMTQSLAKWALHSIDRPAMMTTFLRMKKLMESAGLTNRQLPSRLKGSIRLTHPWLPDWMGDSVWVDPFRMMLPFDSMAYPYEEWQNNQSSTQAKATQYIQDRVDAGKLTQQEADFAIDNQYGPIWDEAETSVYNDQPELKNSAWDFVNMLTPMHAPIIWAKETLSGTPENIGPFTPMSRTLKGAAGLLGVDWDNSPINLEGRLRKQLGLPAFDKWDDYRVDRMLSNMVGTGEITAEQAQRAMIDRTGMVFEEAVRKAGIEFAGGNWWMFMVKNLGVPVQTYPEGEKEQRNLQNELRKAWSMSEQKPELLKTFYDMHPEVSARQALWDGPEERLQKFLVDQIWDKWSNLPKLQKDIITEQFGPEFKTYFLDKNTQNYDNVPTETMQVWLKLMGGDPPGTLNSELPQFEMPSDDVAYQAQVFYDMRNQYFPNFWKLQDEYFDLEGAKAKAYLAKHRELTQYWDWRRDWLLRNPEVAPWIDDQFEWKLSTGQWAYANRGMESRARQEGPWYSADEWRNTMGPQLFNLMQDYIYNDEPLTEPALRKITKLSEQLGITEDELYSLFEDSLE